MAILIGAQALVRQWLMQDRWSVRHGSMDGATWVLTAQDEFGRIVDIGQGIGRNDELFVRAIVAFDGELHAALERLSQEEYVQLVWDLRLKLVRTGIAFGGVDIPLQQVEVGERVFVPLRKGDFLPKLSAVVRGILLVQWTVARKVAQKLPRGQLGFHVPAKEEGERGD